MKYKIGIDILIFIVVFILYVAIGMIVDLWSLNTFDIGPHEIRSVSYMDTVTIPESNITITSQDYFEIQNPVSKEITLPEVIPPSIGETNSHFVIKSPPPGKYILLKASANFYSETPTKITVRRDIEEEIAYSLLILITTILAWGLAFLFIAFIFLDV